MTTNCATCSPTVVASSSTWSVARAATSAKLDPTALTIGFARRFATYKRASLLLLEVDRVIKLLSDDDRPIQFVFAGKAHPADEPGKALLAQVNEFAAHTAAPRSLRVRSRLRHRRRTHVVSRLRRVAQQPGAAARSVRHQRHEGRAQRQPQLLDPRRLVGRALRRRKRLVHPDERRDSTRPPATSKRPHRC